MWKAMIELGDIWQDYGLDRLEEGMNTLFPANSFSLSDMMMQIMEGDIIGVFTGLVQGGISDVQGQLTGMKNIFVWLLVLGIVSALMTHFVEVFDRHQIAEISFYFMYLLFSAILLKCFYQAAQTAQAAIENTVLFIKLLVPTYLISVGIATGTTTVGAYYQLLVLIIYGVQNILIAVVIPLVSCFCMLSVVNGIWMEEKLSLLIELVEKGVGWLLKAAVGVVTGAGIFQAVITPVIDSVKSSALQKALSAVPGIGNAADGVVELVAGSAVVIKNTIGVVLLLLLLLLCAAPLFKIFMISCLLKSAAAFMGIVSDKRITACADRTGDAGMLLFRTTATAVLLFLITISIVATATNRGF